MLRRALPRQPARLLRHRRPDPGRTRRTRRRRPGDLIVAVGGRTGRDGIHGATFSSVELTARVGDGQRRGGADRQRHHREEGARRAPAGARPRPVSPPITDCGAGGFSSAVGEMGAEARRRACDLEQRPAEVRGAVATPRSGSPRRRSGWCWPCRRRSWPELQALCAGEDVEATVLGTFEATGRLRAALPGRAGRATSTCTSCTTAGPPVVRQATWQPPASPIRTRRPRRGPTTSATRCSRSSARYNVCTQGVDHPPVRPRGAGRQRHQAARRRRTTTAPATRRSSCRCSARGAALAIGCGINPRYGDLDPYAMAAAAIDEAVRNVVAVGADPSAHRDARQLLLGQHRPARGARRAGPRRRGVPRRRPRLRHAVHQRQGQPQQRVPRATAEHIAIPPTLLISALGRVPDVRRCVTMDLKEPGNVLYLVGDDAGRAGRLALPPRHRPDRRRRCRGSISQLAPKLFAAVHAAIARRAGAGVPRPERGRPGGRRGRDGLRRRRRGGRHRPRDSARCGLADEAQLFSESPTRFLVEVKPENAAGASSVLRRAAAREGRHDRAGAAAADRRGERRVAGLGEAGRPEGSVAEAAALVEPCPSGRRSIRRRAAHSAHRGPSRAVCYNGAAGCRPGPSRRCAMSRSARVPSAGRPTRRSRVPSRTPAQPRRPASRTSRNSSRKVNKSIDKRRAVPQVPARPAKRQLGGVLAQPARGHGRRRHRPGDPRAAQLRREAGRRQGHCSGALDYLRKLPPSKTYVVGLSTMVFAEARQPRDLPPIQKNVDWLRRERHPVQRQDASGLELPAPTATGRTTRTPSTPCSGCTPASRPGRRSTTRLLEGDPRALRSTASGRRPPTPGTGSTPASAGGLTGPSFTMTVAGVCGPAHRRHGPQRERAATRPDDRAWRRTCGVYDGTARSRRG